MMLISLFLAAAPLQDGTAPAAKPRRDPNKITCISRLRTGSRTNFDQICHTQAEWDLLRTENRRVVERGQQQQNRYNPQEGGGIAPRR